MTASKGLVIAVAKPAANAPEINFIDADDDTDEEDEDDGEFDDRWCFNCS